ncbi:AAA family ATPase [Mastigocoleus testarum]|uniref:Nuclease SbcCD subunit C n=1 Tax=Mastigocoleus testarum BC008 TaxID=371196 RepID=A0A0V7ZVT6_9CYAN|nr:AAA family ATPase [Mastigocoleus testarum]KST64558.1 hypothetical protein BC008_18185 [Mastigocoleus testarum BC008]KST68466.1 hypothetical protein BC008_00930 [Mastigocoleus testarum BC008]
MRSLELELENFTSFRSRQTLDFSKLDLFAITGPTGAGKTSLLDAITFALYGNVPRFGKNAKASQIVSQCRDNLKVSFRFEVPEVEYRVTRTWYNCGKTAKNDVVLEKLNHDKWEKLEIKEKAVTKRVEEILGMDFKKFTRIILLPQGKLDRFIKGRKDKRRAILRKLAGFEVFERTRKQASEKAKIFRGKYKILENQQNDLEIPSDSEITEKKQNLIAIEKETPLLTEKVLKAQQELDRAEKLFENIKRLSQLQNDLSKLCVKDREIENLILQLQQVQAADQIKDNYALLKAARDEDKKAQAAVISVEKYLNQAQQELEKHKQKLEQIKVHQQKIAPQIKIREEALKSAENYEQQRQQYQGKLERNKKNQSTRQENLFKLEKSLEQTEIKLQDTQKQAEKAELAKKKDLAAIFIQAEQILEADRNAHKTALLEYYDVNQEVERREKQLQEVEIKLHELTGGKTCADLKAELEKDKQKLEKQLQKANESYQVADKTVIQYETKDKEASKSAEETAIRKSELEQNWQAALVSSEFTEESFKHALDNSKHQKTWQKQIADYNNQKVKLEVAYFWMRDLVLWMEKH